MSGNAFAFLSAYGATRDADLVARARQFARWGLENLDAIFGLADRPLSLFEGAGGLVALLMALQEPSTAKFPAYEL